MSTSRIAEPSPWREPNTLGRSRVAGARTLLRAARGAWMVAGLTLALIVGLDLMLRLAYTAKDALLPLPAADPRLVAGGYGGASWVARHFAEIEQLEAQYVPYLGFRLAPSQGATIRIGADGSRWTWQPNRPPTGGEPPAHVLVLGGSSAWGMGARDEFTIPSLLARELDRRGQRARVTNLAQNGHVNTQGILALLLELRRGRRPDVVVFYGGVNDVLAAVQSGEAGTPQNDSNRRAEFNIQAHPGRLLAAFLTAVARDSTFGRAAGSVARRLGRAGSPATSTRFDPELAGRVVQVYGENLRVVDALAREYGFRALFAWQPVVFTKRRTPFEDDRATQYSWLAGPFAAVSPKLSEVDAPSDRVQFCDFSHLLDDRRELLFLDFCHTTEAANAILARALADEIEPWLAVDFDGGSPCLQR